MLDNKTEKNIGTVLEDMVVGALLSVLPRRRRLLLLDLALVSTALLMVFTQAVVFFFHIIFLLLAFGAFYWRFRAFIIRSGIWVAFATTMVLVAIIAGETQAEELSEIPLLTAILLLVFAIARQRARAEDALRKTNEELENRVVERTADLTAVNTELVDEIARRQQAEETLRESEERYRRLVELSFEAITIHSEGKFVYVNPAGARLLGATCPQELIGEALRGFVHPDYWDIVQARLRQVGEEGTGVPLFEEKFVRLDGSSVEVEAVSVPIAYDRQPAVQTVIRDISARKRAEAEREMERTRIARDLHDSLGHSLGYLHLKLDQLATSDALNDVGGLACELAQMRDVTNGAYELVRGMLAALLPSGSTDLTTALLAQARTIAERGSFEVHMTTDGRSHPLAPTVQQQLLHLFEEALINVERHANARQVHIELRWETDALTIVMADDGCGFDVDALPISGHYGLRIMQARAQEMNGELDIASLPASGTQVTLRLPLAPNLRRATDR
jgi:PAS domain S-box-containing protein